MKSEAVATIEPAKISHLQQLHAAIDLVAHQSPFLGMTEAPAIAGFAEQMRQHVDTRAPWFVAISQETVIGWCLVYPNPSRMLKHTGHLFMGIVPQSQGQGIGTELLLQSLAASWSYGLQRIDLEVCRENQIAISMYRKCGFFLEGIKKQAYRLDTRYDDVFCMAILHASMKWPRKIGQ